MRTAIHIIAARKLIAKGLPLKLRRSRSGKSMVLWYRSRLLAAFPLENHCI